MKIQLKNEDELRDNLKQAREIIDDILTEKLGEKELTEDSLKQIQNIQNKISRLRYVNYEGSRAKIISSDSTELTEIICY